MVAAGAPGTAGAELEHQYECDDRCKCGGYVVWFDYEPYGHGCEVEGKPWAASVRRKDPQERKYDRDKAEGRFG